MLFNSPEYLIFYLAALAGSWLLVGFPRLRVWMLMFASFYFYASNNGWLLLLLLVCIQIDFLAGKYISQSKDAVHRKLLLAVSMTMNLGLLGFFKYFNFFAETIAKVLSGVGYHASWVDLNIILPIGISFYTFDAMSYTIDVYRGRIHAEKSWYRFCFFIVYFPHLIAGPIIRASEFLHQMGKPPVVTPQQFEFALFRIALGLFKKIVIADFLALYADKAFDNPTAGGFVTNWIGVYAFSFQIYFDFSGYTDIAIGCALLMGYHFPENFRRPYIAQSFSDFWRRWHMSLSHWLRDYLYIPLGGSRMDSKWGIYRNIFITMCLAGLWHGAAWNFVLWGVLLGCIQVFERAFALNNTREEAPFWSFALRGLLIFNLVTLTWIIFRSSDADHFGQLAQSLFTLGTPETITLGHVLVLVIGALAWCIQLAEQRNFSINSFLALPIPVKASVYGAISILVYLFAIGKTKAFIYFQF